MPSEDSAKSAHPCSLIRVFAEHSVGSKDTKQLQSDSKDTDQPEHLGAHAVFITKTRLYNSDPLEHHFYIVKLGFNGVYIIFLVSS